MLEIVVEGVELFDEEKCEFFQIKTQHLKLEHSLVSISKWESKWHKSFLSDREKTAEEILDYIRCMTINQVDPNIYAALSQKNINDIEAYIEDPMTASTVISEVAGKKERITSELMYYWMVAYRIPMECEKWHLNRLLTLIKICNAKNQPAKKMSNREIYNQNRLLNEARRKKYHTKG